MSKHQWILEGLALPGKNRVGLAAALGRQPSMVTELLNGNRELKASEIPKIAQYLGVAPPSIEGAARIVGFAGHDADGAVLFVGRDDEGEARMPAGGTKDTVAVQVAGNAMRGVAQDGWLLYYEDLRKPPGDDMLGELCVVGLADERVLVKYLHRGSGPRLFDLESATAPTQRDVAVLWAALVTAIIPRPQAKKMIRREAKAAPKRAVKRKRRT